MNSLLGEKFKANFKSDINIFLNSLYKVLDHNVNIYIWAGPRINSKVQLH